LAGCRGNSGKEPVYPVTGEVFFQGKPAVGAVVWLHPADAPDASPQNAATDPRPCGVVQADGSFELSTFGVKDGAPVGRYHVTVMWTKNNGGGDGNVESLLPLRHMDPKKSGLPVIEIQTGPNVLPRFELTS
jgi:hypothetical protein